MSVEEVVVEVAAPVDPVASAGSSEAAVVAAAVAVVVVDAARSATNATKWDTLHVTARRIWTGATVVTEAATLLATAACRPMTRAVTTATRAAIWPETVRRRATGT